MQVKGVDISVHNGDVDFEALKAAGVQFVLIRCGYGGDYPGQQDGRFEENVRKAQAAGLPWGVYHYSYARDVAMAKGEAAHCLRLLAGRKPAYGVWLDLEEKSTLAYDLATVADTFCSAMEEAGLYAGVYSNYNWFTNFLTSPVFEKYDRWVAQYPTYTLKKPCGIWQFTDNWLISGEPFDGDISYKDYPSLTKGGNSVNKSRVLQTQQNQITNPFGGGHTGADLGWQTTQTDGVLAHSQGVVTFCQTGQKNNQGSTGNASYGNCVKIKHPNGYSTLYAHLSEVKVQYGQSLEKGQEIGKMGNTGNSYGNHLHFEVRDTRDVCIDPAPYLAADLPGLATTKTEAKEDDGMLTYEQFKDYMARYEQEQGEKPTPTWAEPAMQYAQDQGLIKGDANGKLRPQSHLRRMELAQVLYNAAKLEGKA